MRRKNNTGIIVGIGIAVVCLSMLVLLLLILLGIKTLKQGSSDTESNPPVEENMEELPGDTSEEQADQTGEQTIEEPEDRPQLSDTQTAQDIPVLDSDMVFAGSKHWLFYKSTQDGDTMADYYATNDFTTEQMEKIAAGLTRQAKTIEEGGARFVLLIVPNKEVVYDQYMQQDMIRDSSVVSRTDKLVEYLQQNTDLDVIYVKDKFLSMRNDEKLIYYKTDTHWNMRGCYVAVQEILQDLYGHSRPIEEIEFQEHLYDFAGDLVAKAGVGTDYNVDTVYFLGADQVTEEEKVEDSLLLVGDSFAEFMKLAMEYYFKGGVVDGNVEKYSYNFYQATAANLNQSPDVVVWECCERHIARLGESR